MAESHPSSTTPINFGNASSGTSMDVPSAPHVNMPIPHGHQPPVGPFPFHGTGEVTDHHMGDGTPDDPSHITMKVHQIHLPKPPSQNPDGDEMNEVAAKTIGGAMKKAAAKLPAP